MELLPQSPLLTLPFSFSFTQSMWPSPTPSFLWEAWLVQVGSYPCVGIRQGVVSLPKPTVFPCPVAFLGTALISLTEVGERDIRFVNHRGSLYPGLQTRFLLKAQWSRTQTLRLSPSLWVLVHLTFTMSSPFLKLCKAPLFPTLPQASHFNKYLLISTIQDFFFLHPDSSFTFKTLTFSCPTQVSLQNGLCTAPVLPP